LFSTSFLEDSRQQKVFEDAETVEFAGKAVVHLAADSDVIKKTGRVHLTSDLAYEYGFKDADGEIHGDIRKVCNSTCYSLKSYFN
jgi:dehydrogenase/reductase SDR family protein 1